MTDEESTTLTPEEIFNNPPNTEDAFVVTESTFMSKSMKPVNFDDDAPHEHN